MVASVLGTRGALWVVLWILGKTIEHEPFKISRDRKFMQVCGADLDDGGTSEHVLSCEQEVAAAPSE